MKTETQKWYSQKRRKRTYKKGVYLIFGTYWEWDCNLHNRLLIILGLILNRPIGTRTSLKVFPKDIIFFKRFREKK